MKPIVITIDKDGKVVISVEEFKNFMDDAYWAGYHDNATTLTSTYANQGAHEKWWKDLGVTCATGSSVQEGK